MGRHAASATSRVPPPKAAARILSPSGFEAWWLGPVEVESIDADWPRVGSHMRFRSGGAFDVEVVESELPHRIVMEVASPSGRGRITHTFEATQEGGTRYGKVVESDPTGILGRLFDPLLAAFVRREVRRAAKDADENG